MELHKPPNTIKRLTHNEQPDKKDRKGTLNLGLAQEMGGILPVPRGICYHQHDIYLSRKGHHVLDDSLRWAFSWTKRQMIGVKIYTPRMYWLGLVMALPNLLIVLSPLLLLASLLLPSLALPALLLLATLPVRMATGALFCAIMGRWESARYAYLDYVAIAIGLWGLISSIFSYRFTWGPLTYEIVSPTEARVLGSSRSAGKYCSNEEST
jgi:hypothetical protein